MTYPLLPSWLPHRLYFWYELGASTMQVMSENLYASTSRKVIRELNMRNKEHIAYWYNNQGAD